MKRWNIRTKPLAFITVAAAVLLAGMLAAYYGVRRHTPSGGADVSFSDRSASGGDSAPVVVSLSDHAIEVGKALTRQLKASGSGKITFRSSDEAVATVDEKGVVTGVSVGECVITAADEKGSADSCAVSVKKVCYLTIDDGPTKWTEGILAVLKENDVRATFFVVSSPQLSLTKNMEEQGCVVGLHTYSHRFYLCYASQYSYFLGLDMLGDEVEKYTGHRPTLIRFPGGTGNTRCNSLWMQRNLHGAADFGYTPFDWTSSASDSSSDGSAEKSFASVKKYCTKDEEILLMHDVGFNVTSLRKIIPYLREQGYLFETLDRYPHAPVTQKTVYSRSNQDVPSTGIKLDYQKMSLKVGKSQTIRASIAPHGSTDYTRWESSDPAVAEVLANGKVTGKSKGTADITAITSSGHKAVCHVTVS